MSTFNRENRYLVFKISDVEAALDDRQKGILDGLRMLVARHRESAGKSPLEAVVVEADWPIYEQAWTLIKKMADSDGADWSDNDTLVAPTEQDYRELQSQHDDLQSMLFNMKRERDELMGLIKAVAAHSTSTMIDGTRCASFPWIEYEVVAAKAKGESL
jgi:hypothetical protein